MARIKNNPGGASGKTNPPPPTEPTPSTSSGTRKVRTYDSLLLFNNSTEDPNEYFFSCRYADVITALPDLFDIRKHFDTNTRTQIFRHNFPGDEDNTTEFKIFLKIEKCK